MSICTEKLEFALNNSYNKPMNLLINYLDFCCKSTVVYKITNLVNGKFYIGGAVCYRNRMNKHLSFFKNQKQNFHFQKAWNKYGAHNFIVEVVEYCTIEELNNREQYYLDTLTPWKRKIGYNIDKQVGLKNGANGRRVRKETINKMNQTVKSRREAGAYKDTYLYRKERKYVESREKYKNFYLRKPNGEIKFYPSSFDFFQENPTFSRRCFLHLLSGDSKHMFGWTLPETPVEFYKFVDPLGVVHVVNQFLFGDFWHGQNICGAYLLKVWRKEYYHYKGWTCHEDSNLRYIIRNDALNVEFFSGYGSSIDQCRKFNIDSQAYSKLIKRRDVGYKNQKGWYIKEIFDPLDEFPQLIKK